MKHYNFIDEAHHNFEKQKRNTRIFLTIIGICAILVLISLPFYGIYTENVIVTNRNGISHESEIGWPVIVFSWSSFFGVAFGLMLLLIRFGQDMRKPAFATTNQGIYINQQMIRNLFVPWNNIKSIELKGQEDNPIIRIKFKDIDALLKNQFFIYRALSKSNLKNIVSFRISKDESIGDLKKMYEFIKDRV